MTNDYINCTKGTLYNSYRTRTFSEIFPSAVDFLTDYKESGLSNAIKDNTMNTLYYLLYSKYGNWHIANSDENQFKYKCWSNIFTFGPTWEKRLEIQEKLRNLSDEELLKGSTQIFNTSLNPGQEPTTQTTEELETINQQNVNKYVRSSIDGYQYLYDLLKTDITSSFINKFKDLFNPFAMGELPLYYISEE